VLSAVGDGEGVKSTDLVAVGGLNVGDAGGALVAARVRDGIALAVAEAAGAGAVGAIGVGDFHAACSLDGLLPDAKGMARPTMPARTSVTTTTITVLGRSMCCIQRFPILAWVWSAQQSVRPLPRGLASHLCDSSYDNGSS
jgi:hypothetical protein